MMQSYRPAAPLSEYVESFWAIANTAAHLPRQRIYPSGAMELVIHLEDERLSFYEGNVRHSIRVPLLAGPYSRAFSIDPSEYTAVVGVRFKPGAARVFFPLSAQEIQNADVPLELLYPQEARELREQLLSTSGFRNHTRVLERYLLAKLRKADPLHPAVLHAVKEFTQSPGVHAVSKVQSETGFSHTHFIQVFREHVGLTPKLFCRLQRFRSVLERIEQGRSVNWAGVAADCGYFDQAHLIHDFRAFSGMTPLEYTQLSSDHTAGREG